MMRREEPMEEQISLNKEKDTSYKKQKRQQEERKYVRKMGKQGEIATKPKPNEVRDIQERET